VSRLAVPFLLVFMFTSCCRLFVCLTTPFMFILHQSYSLQSHRCVRTRLVVARKAQLPQTLHSLIRNEITAQTAVTATTHEIRTGDGSVATPFCNKGEFQLPRRFPPYKIDNRNLNALARNHDAADDPLPASYVYKISRSSAVLSPHPSKVPQGVMSSCRRTNYVCTRIHSTRYALVHNPSCRLVPSPLCSLSWSRRLCQCRW
jgi:hypothetical protein